MSFRHIGNKVIHCKTEEEKNKFLELAEKENLKWVSGQGVKSSDPIQYNQNELCFRLDNGELVYGGLEFYERWSDFPIITFERFLLEFNMIQCSEKINIFNTDLDQVEEMIKKLRSV